MTQATEHFDQAQLLQWQWKTEATLRVAVAVVNLALGLHEFAADDLPENLDQGGQGIAGSIFARLEQNGIIRRVGVWSSGEFYGKERASRRPGRKAAKLKVYELASFTKARSFLESKQVYTTPQQAELIPC